MREALVLASSTLLFLSFLPFKGCFLIAFWALVPFFSVERKLKDYFLLGFFFYLLSLYWLPRTIESYGQTGWPLAVGAYLLLCFVLSFFYLLWGILEKIFPENPVFSAASFTLFEVARERFLYGFPLLSLAHTQALVAFSYSPMLRLTGEKGLTFLIVFFNKAISESLKRKKTTPELLISAILLAFLTALPKGSNNNPKLKVAVVQPSLSEETKWNPEYIDRNSELIAQMIKKACKNADLVVAPETTLPFYFQKDKKRTEIFLSEISCCKSYVVLGALSYRIVGGRFYFVNRAYLIKKGKILDFYDKTILVPFGEFFPFKGLLLPIYRRLNLPEDFYPGNGPKVLTSGDLKIFTGICYEMAFSRYVAAGAREAELLANITNDMWFGKTLGPYLQLYSAVLRSAETKKFLVRSANTGISAVVDSNGKIFASLPLFKRGILQARVSLEREKTFFCQHPDWFAKLCFLLVFFQLIRRKIISAARSRTE